MPANFGETISAKELEQLVEYLIENTPRRQVSRPEEANG